MFKNFVSALYLINMIAQAIFTLLCPPSLLFFVAWLLVNKLSMPTWIYAVAIVLGIFIGLFSMIKFLLTATKSLERLEKEREATHNAKKEENNSDIGKSNDE